MKRTKPELFAEALIFLVQAGFAFLIIFSIYMLMAMEDFEAGIDGYIGLLVISAPLGLIFTSIFILICFIVGLPIRLIPSLNKWWRNHNGIISLGVVIGILLIIISYLPAFRKHGYVDYNGEMINKSIPNAAIGTAGFILLGFLILHLYPPKFIANFLDKITQKIFSK